MNKAIAYGFIASFALNILGAITDNTIDSGTFYMLAGLGFWVFGIWTTVAILRQK